MNPSTKIALLFAAVLSLLPLSGLRAETAIEGAEVGKWTMDFDAAAKLAKEKDLPILLNFTGSDWCGWCKLMDRQVFAQPEWKEYAAKNIVLVTIDFPQDQSIVPPKYAARNDALQRQFGVRGYPTYIILDSDGKRELGRLGASRDASPGGFIAALEKTLAKRPAKIEEKVKALGPAKGEQYRAALKAAEAAEQDLEKWIATGPERTPANEAKFERLRAKIEETQKALEAF